MATQESCVSAFLGVGAGSACAGRSCACSRPRRVGDNCGRFGLPVAGSVGHHSSPARDPRVSVVLRFPASRCRRGVGGGGVESGVCCRERAALQQQQGSKGRRFRAGPAASFLCSAAPGALRVLLAVSSPPPPSCSSVPPPRVAGRTVPPFRELRVSGCRAEAGGGGAVGPRCFSPACPPLPFPFRRTGKQAGVKDAPVFQSLNVFPEPREPHALLSCSSRRTTGTFVPLFPSQASSLSLGRPGEGPAGYGWRLRREPSLCPPRTSRQLRENDTRANSNKQLFF